MWQELGIALCLMLVLEGILPFLYPRQWRGAVLQAARLPTASYGAGQHAAGYGPSISASLKACAARIERGMAKWQR